MIYYKYLSELKCRITLLLLTWLSSLITCYIYKETLLFLLISLSESQNLTHVDKHLIFTSITELFSTYINLALFLAAQTVVILGIYHLLLFLTPSFYLFEYRNALFFVRILFLVGWFSISFLHKILLPLSWGFFMDFSKGQSTNAFDLFFEAKVDQYFEYYTSLYYTCLLSSSIIVISIISVKFLSSSLKNVRTSRRLYYCFFILLATLVTPPDISSQLFLSLCFSGFYEIFVFMSILTKNKLVWQPIKTN